MKFWNRFKNDKVGMVSLIIILLILLAGIFASSIAPNDPTLININDKFMGICIQYPLGTDQLGRCILSRLLFGIRTTVLVSIITMIITVTIGTILGVIAGFFRGWIDEIIMRLCDIMLSFPSEVMILAIVGIMGVGITNVVIANIIAKWAWYTRMIRSIVIQYTDKNYIKFAKVSGCSTYHIITKHLLHALAGEIAVLSTLDTGWVILNISALSFLGLGVQAPTPEWGMMLSEAKNVMLMYPMQMLPSGIAILIVVSAFNFLGDSLQDAFNAKKVYK